MAQPTVFLDRDGTLNIDAGYVTRPECVVLIDGAATSVGRLKRAGFTVVVVSNQSAIGRGFATEEAVQRTNERLQELLVAEDADAQLDAILYCPHVPETGCGCRKPETGLVLASPLASAYERTRSYIVGDKLCDIDLGLKLRLDPASCVLVQTGDGKRSLVDALAAGRTITSVPSIVEAVDHVLQLATGAASP